MIDSNILLRMVGGYKNDSESYRLYAPPSNIRVNEEYICFDMVNTCGNPQYVDNGEYYDNLWHYISDRNFIIPFSEYKKEMREEKLERLINGI